MIWPLIASVSLFGLAWTGSMAIDDGLRLLGVAARRVQKTPHRFTLPPVAAVLLTVLSPIIGWYVVCSDAAARRRLVATIATNVALLSEPEDSRLVRWISDWEDM